MSSLAYILIFPVKSTQCQISVYMKLWVRYVLSRFFSGIMKTIKDPSNTSFEIIKIERKWGYV